MSEAPHDAPDAEIRRLRAEVIRLFREGREISRVHKEGGETLHFRLGTFACERYGDGGDTREAFDDPEQFLDFLWQGWYWKYSGTPGEPELSDAAAWQKIIDQLRASNPSFLRFNGLSTAAPSANTEFYRRYQRARMLIATFVAVGALLAAVVFSGFGGLLKIRTIGSPAGGEAIGTPNVVVLLISQLVPYVPSLHRDRSKDRYQLSLLVEPRSGDARRRLIELPREYEGGQVMHAAKAIGFDGRVAWFHANGLTGWDVIEHQLITEEDVRRANPGLDGFWNEAYLEMNNGLIASTRDNRIIVRIDPVTLNAERLSAIPPSKRPFPPHPVDALRIETEPAAEPDAHDTSWLRSAVDAPELRLDNPPSRIRMHLRKISGVLRMLVIARIDDQGHELWSVETGIDDVHQILPDPKILAFIGNRPAIPDKAPEPIITFVNTHNGTVRTESLLFGK